jgi:PHD/YefM family antitoxin component YafN of YafNO toxin-antitoxin module
MRVRTKPQFIVDANGTTTGVLISVKEYERLQADTQRTLQRDRLLGELREALLEVSTFQASGQRPPTLREFIKTL